MLAFAYYLLKVIICSAVLFGYYWFFLRNKIYHAYNRYYLLALVFISIAFPLFSIQIFHETAANTNVIKMLQVVNAGDEYMDEIIINTPVKTTLGAEQFVMFIYGIVSIVFFLFIVQMLFSIFKLIKENEKIKIENFHFINTDAAKGTPFSFFQFIFWNKQIDMQSPAGNRIFKHELAHIQERHSWDKMFINLVLIAFWINPIFWLVRKELSMIHEFIADKKAVEDGDTAAFAAMILEATYPQRTFFITNSFFYSPIKRRLMMLTKIKNARTGYISRLLVLPLLVFVFAAFTLKAKEIGADKKIKKSVDQLMNKIIGAKSIDSKSDDEATQSKNVFADRKITVVIDAGHGGSDGGAMNKDGIFEKDIALQLIKKIDALNTNDNIRIILSRTEDVFSDPKQKAAFAKAQNPDLFISVHLYNTPKAKWNTVSGMSVFVARYDIENSGKSKAFASSIINAFKNHYSLNVPTTISQRNGGIWILQANTFPSVLIEAGYLTNDIDAKYLQSNNGQEVFAKNVLKAISDFAATKLFIDLQQEKAMIDSPPVNRVEVEQLENSEKNKALLKNPKCTDMSIDLDNKNNILGKGGLVVINNKIYKTQDLNNKLIKGGKATVYKKGNTAIIKKFGAEAANGIIIIENATIETNYSTPKINNYINSLSMSMDSINFVDANQNKIKLGLW